MNKLGAKNIADLMRIVLLNEKDERTPCQLLPGTPT